MIDYQQFCGVPGSSPGQEEAGAVESITVQQLKTLLDQGAEDLVLLDVRNAQEAEIARIPGAKLVPLNTIESGAAVETVRTMAAGRRLYVHCKDGGTLRKSHSGPAPLWAGGGECGRGH